MDTQLHKEIASWLFKFRLIPPDSPALRANAAVRDLIAVIRDGVVLCQLVHSLDPGCVDMSKVIYDPCLGGSPGDGPLSWAGAGYAGPPSTAGAVSDFLCRNNIYLFLHAIVSRFGLDMKVHYFRPEDLYLCKDVGKVFAVLSALSHSPKVLKSGVPGFPRKEKLLKRRIKAESSHYEALNRLYGEAETEYVYESFNQQNLANNNVAVKGSDRRGDGHPEGDGHDGTSSSSSPSPSSSAYYSKYMTDIYTKILPPKPPRFTIGPNFGQRRKKQAQAPINELLETEDKYLENLIMVRDKYRERLTQMPYPERAAIFYCWDDLVLLHSDILFDFKQKNADLGETFLRHLPRLTSFYGGYCVNLPKAMDLLERLTNANLLLKKQLIECQESVTFPLSAYLAIPFQRFLKYHLLLKEILKHVPEDDCQHRNLSRAVVAVLEAGNAINEMKREHEDRELKNRADLADMNVIRNVAASIRQMRVEDGLSLLDYGRLRKAGEIESHLGCAGSGNSRDSFRLIGDYAFVFDMIILLCHRPKYWQHRYRFQLALKTKDHVLKPLTLRGGKGGGSGYKDDDNDHHRHQGRHTVLLVNRVDPCQMPLSLVAKSETERSAWFNALRTAMDSVNPPENSAAGHVLQMATFEGPVDCNQCQGLLAGRFFQGYRCLRCRALLHRECLANYACLEFAGIGIGGGGAGAGVANGHGNTGAQGSMSKAHSVVLPTMVTVSHDGVSLDRSQSTLSLVVDDGDGSFRSRRNSTMAYQHTAVVITEHQTNVMQELEAVPLEEQSWYAGDLPARIANDRLGNLPLGTFLVRRRANGMYALMLRTADSSKAVKSMKVEKDLDGLFYLSEARRFQSIVKLVSFYRTRDLTENFNYPSLVGITLKTPYKDV